MEQVEGHLQQAFTKLRGLAAEDPQNPLYGEQLQALEEDAHQYGDLLGRIALGRANAGQLAEADRFFRPALWLAEQYRPQDERGDWASHALLLTNHAWVQEGLGRLEEARQTLHRALDAWEAYKGSWEGKGLPAKNLDNLTAHSTASQAEIQRRLGELLTAAGRLAEAEAVYRRGLELWQQLSAAQRKFYARFGGEALCEASLADGLHEQGKTAAARDVFRSALPRLAPDEQAWRLATCPVLELCDPHRAAELAQAELDNLARQPTPNYGDLAAACNRLGAARCAAGEWGPAITALEHACDEAVRWFASGPDRGAAVEALERVQVDRQGGLRGTLYLLALAHARQENKEKARYWFDLAVRHHQTPTRDLEVRRLRAQAAAALGLPEPPAPKIKGTPPPRGAPVGK
jgi:tetratricopeptide (TPR) repeat protein